jgi:EmrB/QacA subfamily drug resistance transporter
MLSEQRRRWLTLLAMTGSLSMIMIDQTVVSVALPRIQQDLNLSQSGLQWVMNAYILALAATVAVGGRLGDILGRLKGFVGGVILFAAASAVCGLAQNEASLVAARVLQGIAAAFMQPASAAIVTSTFPLRERGRAMAVYAGVAMSLMAAGPLLGGAITEYASWRWVFWINLPVAAVAVTLALVFSRSENTSTREPVDLAGLSLLVLGMPALVFGIQQGHVFGWSSPVTLGTVFGGLALIGALIFVERRVPNPLIDVGLFENHFFMADALLLFFIQFGLVSQTVFLSVYIQRILGFSPLNTGLSLLILVVPAVAVSQAAGRIFDRVGVKPLAVAGSLLITLGFLSHALFLHRQSFGWVIPGMFLFGTGAGLVLTPANTDGLSRLPQDRRGQASGLLQTLRQLGSTLGLAVIGTLFAGVERSGISRLVETYPAPEGNGSTLSRLLQDAAEGQAAALREISASEPELLAGLKAAAARGITAGFTLSTAVMLLALLVAVFMMRPGRQTQDG